MSYLATRRGKLTLALLCGIAFLDFVDGSITNVALPSIRRSLHFSVDGLTWVPSAYLLTYGGFMLLGGRLADLIGRVGDRDDGIVEPREAGAREVLRRGRAVGAAPEIIQCVLVARDQRRRLIQAMSLVIRLVIDQSFIAQLFYNKLLCARLRQRLNSSTHS